MRDSITQQRSPERGYSPLCPAVAHQASTLRGTPVSPVRLVAMPAIATAARLCMATIARASLRLYIAELHGQRVSIYSTMGHVHILFDCQCFPTYFSSCLTAGTYKSSELLERRRPRRAPRCAPRPCQGQRRSVAQTEIVLIKG